MPELIQLRQATGVIVDPEPTERGQLLALATTEGGRRVALVLNTN